jgi:hypothetical protein
MSFSFETQDQAKHKLDMESESHIFQDILEGLAYIRKTKVLAHTLLTYCLALLVFSARFASTRVAFMGSVCILSYGATQIGVEKVYLLSGSTLLLLTILLFSLAILEGKTASKISKTI